MTEIRLKMAPLLAPDEPSYTYEEVLDSKDVGFFLIGVYRAGGSLVSIERVND